VEQPKKFCVTAKKNFVQQPKKILLQQPKQKTSKQIIENQ
jgi:hypothetical protein